MNMVTLIDTLIAREGGFVDHPADRGGATRWGITTAVARANGYHGSIRDLPRSVAATIYASVYWRTPGFDQVAARAPDLAAEIPSILKTIIEELGGNFVRSGFIGFGASSLDFEVEFDVYLPGWDEIYLVRHKSGLAVLREFNARGIEFAYPTQTTFTAAPDGRMIMPYAEVQPVRRVDE